MSQDEFYVPCRRYMSSRDANSEVDVNVVHPVTSSSNAQVHRPVVTTSATNEDLPITPAMSQQQQQGHSRNPSSTGGSGVDSSLVRPKRRVIKNNARKRVNMTIERNYAISDGVMFTNFVELKNDMISPEYAQEMIEKFMETIGIDMSNDKATRMVEDVIFTFYVQNAASQKTGHEKVIDVYGVEMDMMVLLRILVSEGVTPRRFTRALADRIFLFLRAPENADLRADLVSKYSLDDPDHAALAFDGSTHVTNLTTDRKEVANMLASRGIYENVASVKNASERSTYDGVLNGTRVKSGVLHNGAS